MKPTYEDYSREDLIRLIRERDRKPRFGLVWERDEIEHDRSVNSDFVALDLDTSTSYGEGPYSSFVIEGDNFDVLRYLRMTHSGKVKCIYIDPPYNTGNRDFIYNDRFVEKEDLYRHSKWLEFMYRRIVLAKDLLTEDGAIVVSIDDNEVFHLGLLMDQVFGEHNRIATCVWQKRYSRENREAIGDVHEYILIYARDPDLFKRTRNKIPLDEAQAKVYRNPDNPNETDPKKRWRGLPMTAQGFRPNQMYKITAPNGTVHEPPDGRCWSMIESEFEKLKAAGRIHWGKNGGAQPSVIRFLSEVDGLVPWTWWPHEEVGHTDEAKKEIQDIFGTQTAFSTPKPVRLMERILRIISNPGDIVLDFFAGSGTTAQAVLNLNRQDQGSRRFIMVSSTEATTTSPETNICRDVCAERIRRVTSGYQRKAGGQASAVEGSFGYLRARRISVERVYGKLEHSQAWVALQLIHAGLVSEYRSGSHVQSVEDGAGIMLYVATITEDVVRTVKSAIQQYGRATVYSWQPALLEQRISDPRVSFAPIPQFLVNRFGAGVQK